VGVALGGSDYYQKAHTSLFVQLTKTNQVCHFDVITVPLAAIS